MTAGTESDRTFEIELACRLATDEVDSAPRGIAPIQGSLRSTEDLDPIDVAEIQSRDLRA